MSDRGNMPVLYQNIMDGLPSDLARDAFLWAVEQPGEDRYCYRAERFARELHMVVGTVRWLLAVAADVHERDTYDSDLLRFIVRRHCNMLASGNARPDFVEWLA